MNKTILESPNPDPDPQSESQPSPNPSNLEMTLGNPSQNLRGAGSGLDTFHSTRSLMMEIAVQIWRFISLQYFFRNRRDPRNELSNEEIDEFARSIVSNFSVVEVRILYVKDLQPNIEEDPAAFELLPMNRREIDRRLKYWAQQRELIEIRKTELEAWNSRVQRLIRENKEQGKELFEFIQRKRQKIRDHCNARKEQLRQGPAYNRANVAVDYEAQLDSFCNRYNERVELFRYIMKKIEKQGKNQDKQAEKERKKLLGKYKVRTTSHGRKKSLYFYEISFIREVRKQYEQVQNMKRALMAFINEVQELEEAKKRVLGIRNVLREIEIGGENLTRARDWEEFLLVNNEKPLVIMEKRGYYWSEKTLGRVGEVRMALTADKFLVVYKVSANSKLPTVYEQFKISEIMGRKDLENSENSPILFGWTVKKPRMNFRLEFLDTLDMKQFLEYFENFYDRSFLEEEILNRNHHHN